MWSIVIGVLFILAGLSGEAVLRGTNVSWPLVPIGVGLIAWGIISIGEAHKQAGVSSQHASRQEPHAEEESRRSWEEEQREAEEEEREWERLLDKNPSFSNLFANDSELDDYFDSDFRRLAVEDPHFRATLVADPNLRESLKSDDWFGDLYRFEHKYGFGLWCEACEKKREERAERDRRRSERKPDPVRVSQDLFARQQALYEALKTFEEQNPVSAESGDLEDQDWARRRRYVYLMFLSPDEERQWDDSHLIAQSIARTASQEAEDAGAEQDDASETFQSVYDREMAARVPPVLRFYYE